MLRSQPMPAELTSPNEMSAGRYGSACVSSCDVLVDVDPLGDDQGAGAPLGHRVAHPVVAAGAQAVGVPDQPVGVDLLEVAPDEVRGAVQCFAGSGEAQSAGVVKTMSSGVPAGAIVSPSSGASHPLTFESMVIRRATSNAASADVATSLPAR